MTNSSFSKAATIWLLGERGPQRSQPLPENTSPRATVKAELHVTLCHVDGQEVFAARVIAVQEDAVTWVRPKCNLKLHEGKIMLGLQWPGCCSIGSILPTQILPTCANWHLWGSKCSVLVPSTFPFNRIVSEDENESWLCRSGSLLHPPGLQHPCLRSILFSTSSSVLLVDDKELTCLFL